MSASDSAVACPQAGIAWVFKNNPSMEENDMTTFSGPRHAARAAIRRRMGIGYAVARSRT